VAAGAIKSPAVEAAFRAVPRHVFVPEVSAEHAYRNEAIPTKLVDGHAVSSASQPSIVAVMLEQLDVQPGQRVLEIEAGTGYNAALLARLVGPSGHVVTVDLDEDSGVGTRGASGRATPQCGRARSAQAAGEERCGGSRGGCSDAAPDRWVGGGRGGRQYPGRSRCRLVRWGSSPGPGSVPAALAVRSGTPAPAGDWDTGCTDTCPCPKPGASPAGALTRSGSCSGRAAD
jgi:hypothetical protein